MSAVVSARGLRRLAVVCGAAVGAAVLIAPAALAAGDYAKGNPSRNNSAQLDHIVAGSVERSSSRIVVQTDLMSGSQGFEDILRTSNVPLDFRVPASVAWGDVTGDGRADLIVGAGKDGQPYVGVFDGATRANELIFLAYNSAFKGGVRVAVGDVDGDGKPELITGAGPRGGPQVNVYKVTCAAGKSCDVSLLKSFFAYSAPSFTGGIYVAAGDTNGDGKDDIVVGAGASGGSRVQVWTWPFTATLNDFFTFSPAFVGGVKVAVGDVNADGKGEVITTPATLGGSLVRVFSVSGKGNSPSVLTEFFAFGTTVVGGFSVASGQFDAVPGADIAVAFGPRLRTFSRLSNGPTPAQISEITLPPGFEGTESIAAGKIPEPAPAPAPVSRQLRVGVAEDAGKYADDGGRVVARDLTALGMQEQRWTLQFDPARPTVIAESAFLDRAVPVAVQNRIRIVLSLFQLKAAAPEPGAFCDWAVTVARRYTSIRTFIIGNEVNATRFWSPQHTADDQDAGPRSYLAVLTACYDALKAVSSDIDVIGMALSPRSVDANSTKPLEFIRVVGRLYRASGRTKPIMDALAVHPYPNPNANPPPAPDAAAYQDAGFYGIPQLDRVKQAAFDAFDGTGQPGPLNGLSLVIDEVGYQTNTDGNSQYTGREGSPVVSDELQATYYARIVSLYACDPLVSDVLFFHLIDEAQRNPDATSGGWQSGLQRPNGEAKPSFDAVKKAIAAGCSGDTVAWAPAIKAELTPVSGGSTPPSTPGSGTGSGTSTGTGSSGSTPTAEQQLNRLEEALPSASVDGPVFDMITLPDNLKQAIIDRSVPRQITGPDGRQQWLFDPGEAFWQTDLQTQKSIFMGAWIYKLNTDKAACTSATCFREIEENLTLGWLLIDNPTIQTLCKDYLLERASAVCKGRGLSARRPVPALKVYASGSATLKKGARLTVKMKRTTKVAPGIYFTLVRVQSATDPKKLGFIISRPYNVTAAKLKADRAPKQTKKPTKKRK